MTTNSFQTGWRGESNFATEARQGEDGNKREPGVDHKQLTTLTLPKEKMPIVINEVTYYRTAEVCRMVGVSRSTLFRWLKEGKFSDVEYRDWRGWRLFTLAQLETIRAKTSHITEIHSSLDR